MGGCVSNENQTQAGKISKKIDKSNLKDFKTDVAHKILLLGPGESGKSTFQKQLQIAYTETVNPERYVEVVYDNVLSSMKTLISYQNKCSAEDDAYCLTTPNIDSSVTALEEVNTYGPHHIDEKMAAHVALLWADPAIKLAYENRSKLQIPDACSYFFDRIDAISADDYLPSNEDIIRCTFRTTGIKETTLLHPIGKFNIVDVGGQRNERSKWIHLFEKCSAVVFFAAISEYDQVLREDYSVNRFDETLKLFEEISNSRWFKDCTMILFLNKIDLFREKLKRVPLSTYFPDYEGGADYDKACEHVRRVFEERCMMKHVHTNFTAVIDGTSIKQLFESLASLVIRLHLQEANLL